MACRVGSDFHTPALRRRRARHVCREGRATSRGLTGTRQYLKLQILTITYSARLAEATVGTLLIACDSGRRVAHNQKSARNAMTLSVA